jgi:hypothetical protein
MSTLVGGSATWTPAILSGSPANPCPTLNQFGLNLQTGPSSSTDIDGTDRTLGPGPLLANVSGAPLGAALTMPCVGSSGAGASMSGTITITVTF